jgi:hypothetical protein
MGEEGSTPKGKHVKTHKECRSNNSWKIVKSYFSFGINNQDSKIKTWRRLPVTK